METFTVSILALRSTFSKALAVSAAFAVFNLAAVVAKLILRTSVTGKLNDIRNGGLGDVGKRFLRKKCLM